MTILLLGGTNEGRVIAETLDTLGLDVVTSLAGVTRAPAPVAGRTRTGGFGGESAFRTFLVENAISAVVDATHPFARAISERSAAVTSEMGLKYLQVMRPPWRPVAGDNWTEIENESDAANHIDPPANVFLATGRQTLDRFSNLSGCRVYCRQIDPPTGPFPFANGEFVVGRPPFSVDEERALFLRLGIGWLVTKNSGGDRARSKLDAARKLGLPVLMIKRPGPVTENWVESADEAIEWVKKGQWV